jgi:ATP/maltotriose-dependent transcriptional regulator MalT/DNA-binding SARP family transcriptional activator
VYDFRDEEVPVALEITAPVAGPRQTPAAKLRPPVPGGAQVARPALLERLSGARRHRLTTVIAGPGFGKSTALAAWAATVPSAWYTVMREDRVLPVLAGGLADALSLPDVLAAAGGERGPGGDETARAESIAALLAGALEERLDSDLVLVLDDVHELPARSPSARLVDALVRQAPQDLHVVLVSRDEPPFRVERLRGRGQVLDIGAEQLAFDEAEVAGILAASLDEVPPSLPAAVSALTAGWPAAVRLTAEALRARPAAEREQAFERLVRPEGALFSYLAEEVFAPQPKAVRDLLRTVAPFERFNPALCEALGLARADEQLRRLARRGLFVQSSGGPEGWYGLHALAREFALESRPLDEDELRRLHRLAAAWFEDNDHPEEALRSFTAAGDPEPLADALRRRGPELLAAGSIEPVLAAVDALPEQSRDARIEQLAGEARQIRGDWEGALASFRRAGAGAAELEPGAAWRMGVIHYLRGELDDALRIYEHGRVDGSDPEEEAVLLAWTATARWVRGEVDDARVLADQALSVAREADADRGLAAAHTVHAMLASVEGRRADGTAHSERALEHALRAGDLLQVIRIRSNRGSHLSDEGEYEAALAEIDEALGLADLAGFANFSALGLSNRGDTKLKLGLLDEALADLEAARAAYERLGSHALAYPLGHLGDAYRERGELALSRAAYEEAIATSERARDAQGLAPALAGLARVVAVEDLAAAQRLADRAAAEGTGVARVAALLSSGWVALAAADRDGAARCAEEARAAARERHDRAGLAEAVELGVLAAPDPASEAAQLEEAVEGWRRLGNTVAELRARVALGRLSNDAGARAVADRADRRLRALGVRTRPPLAAGLLASLPTDRPSPVTVRCLGGFGIWRDGMPVPLGEWQSKKARDLLKLLVARRGHPVMREVLMDSLWPGEDPAKVTNRLSVALATVRSVLDPEHRHGQDHFVAADGGAVRLRREHLSIDVEDFLVQADRGLTLRGEGGAEAVSLLEAAEDAYVGDFLEEDPYDDWAVALREEARAAYASVARALAAEADRTGDPDGASRYRLRILERDPHDEEAHLGLAAALVRAGRHGEARRAYRTYVTRMEEIGAEPAAFPSLGAR